MTLPDPVQYAVPGFIALVLAEMLVAWAKDKSRYEPRDTLTSLLLGLGSTVAGALSGGAVFALATWVWQFRAFDIGYQWYWFVVAFVLDDLAYYVFHRSAHRVRWFWASHVIHHSSQHYNLSTALRQTWTGFFSIGFIFRLPLFLIGFPPALVFFVAAAEPDLPVLDSYRGDRADAALVRGGDEHAVAPPRPPRHQPALSRHQLCRRVHRLGPAVRHVRARARRRCSALRHRQELGSFNVVWAAVHEWVGIAQDVWKAPGLRAKIGYLVMPPGWSHDGSRDTSETIKARWRQAQEVSAWKKPISSSSGADQAARPQPDG